jgi:hypothetical protein
MYKKGERVYLCLPEAWIINKPIISKLVVALLYNMSVSNIAGDPRRFFDIGTENKRKYAVKSGVHASC